MLAGLFMAGGLLAMAVDAAALGPFQQIVVEGNRTADTKLVLRTLNVPLGEPVSRRRLQAGARALHNLGVFSDISFVSSAQPDSAACLIVRLAENPRLTAVDFLGNEKIGTEDLKGKILIRSGQILSRPRLWESCRAVERAYVDEGYAKALCLPAVDASVPGEAAVTLQLEEGPRVKISRVEVAGNAAFSDKTLRGKLSLKKNSLFRRKRYTADRVQEDRQKLEDFYRNHGYRDAVVTLEETEFLEEGRAAVLSYVVAEGRPYVFGPRTWRGNESVATTALEQAAKFVPGDPFSQEKLEQTTGEAYALYTDRGYLLEISIIPETSLSGDTVRVEYEVTEGRQSHVREIAIRGNRSTKERVIRREVLLYPGDLLRRSALLRAQRDIFALGFFEDVQMDYEPTGEGTDVDLTFRVKERSSGQAGGGIGYSGETGLTGTLELRHPNIFGTGQSVSLFLERGGKRENYEISYQNPWMLGTPISFGFDVFNTRRERDLYTETRRGGGVSLGRVWPYRFPDYTRVYVGYNLEDFEFSNFDRSLEETESSTDGVPIAERLRESAGVISSTYLLVSRNSTDNPFYPTFGAKTLARFELAGGALGGQQHYIKPTLDHRIYFRPFWKPVLMLRWRLGWLAPLSGKDAVPSTETFRLGGTRVFESLRGYDDYDIVPAENAAVRFPGGRSMFAFTSEVQFPIVHPLHGLFFFEAGDTWRHRSEIGLTGLRAAFGPGLRFEIPMLGPIGLDYAYGTAARDWRFHFIIGTSL